MKTFQNLNAVSYRIWRRLRGSLSRLKWVWREYFKLGLMIGSAYVTFVLASYQDWSEVSLNLFVYVDELEEVGLVSTALGLIIAVFRGADFVVLSSSRIELDRHQKLTGSDVILRPSEKVSDFNKDEQSIIYSPDVNKLLETSSNMMEWNTNIFKLHPLIDHMLPYFIHVMPEVDNRIFDDSKVRLHTSLDGDLLKSGNSIELQKTSYFRDRLSNTLANYMVRLDDEPLLDLREQVLDEHGQLMNLESSQLSNQLGGSTLLITSDAMIFSLRQGKMTAENHGCLVSAGSGSFDPIRKKKFSSTTFQDYVRAESKRELLEECGIKPKHIRSIQLCGYGRYLYRNGKPEIFCIASTTLTSNNIKVPAREWGYQRKTSVSHKIEGPLTPENLKKSLAEFRKLLWKGEGRFRNACGPLYWNVKFAEDYMDIISPSKLQELTGRTI